MRKGCFGIILLILLSTGYCAHKAGMNDSMWSATVGNTLGFPATEASQSIPSTFADSLGRHPRSKALLVMSDGTLSQSQKKALTGRLQREGAMAVVFISQNSLVAIGYERVAKDAIRLPGITWVGRLRWEAKKEAAIEELTQHLETNEKLTRFWRKEGAVALVVSLPHGGPCAFTRAAQDDIMRRMVPEPRRVVSESCSNIVIEVADNAKTLSRSADWLSKQEFVTLVSVKRNAQKDLDKVVPVVHGKNKDGNSFIRNDVSSELDGSGMKIAVGDTGIDKNHCFFSTKDVTFADAFGSDEDVDGHGSHVAGILLSNGDSDGNHLGTVSKSNPLIFNFNDPDGELLLPSNLDENYLRKAADKGAKLSVNSWGIPDVDYIDASKQVDEFHKAEQSGLSVFSAGNLRDPLSGDESEVRAPSNAKNAMAAGASLSPRNTPPRGKSYLLRIATNSFDKFKFPAVRATFGTQGLPSDVNVAQAPDDNKFGCKPLDSSTFDGKVALVKRGECTFVEKAKNAQNANAIALLVENSFRCGDWNRMDAKESETGIEIPAVMCSRNDCQRLAKRIESDPDGDLRVEFGAAESVDAKWEHLASFSSRGPTPDGRIKPDVVAVGERVESADAGTSCSVTTLSGTSMAAPLVTGALAIAKEYLQNRGDYGGTALSDPSGALLKALIINGAKPMTGFALQGAETIPLEATPSCEQGFGHVNVTNSLELEDVGSSERSLFVKDGEKILNEDDTKIFCYEMASEGEFRATLAWTDVAGDLRADKQLINDLDLNVTASKDVEFPLDGRDERNTVERVFLPQVNSGVRLAVEVTATTLNEAQTFALAVIGPLTEETASSVDNCVSGGTTMSRPTLDAGKGDSGGDDAISIFFIAVLKGLSSGSGDQEVVDDFKRAAASSYGGVSTSDFSVNLLSVPSESEVELDVDITLAQDKEDVASTLFRDIKADDGPSRVLTSSFVNKYGPVSFTSADATVAAAQFAGRTLGINDDTFRDYLIGTCATIAVSIVYSVFLYRVMMRNKVDTNFTLTKGVTKVDSKETTAGLFPRLSVA